MQFVANAVVSAASIFLMGLSFSLAYRSARFFHLSHGAIFTLGAYMFWWGKEVGGLSTSHAVIVACLIGAFAGVVLELGIYGPARQRGATPLGLLLASLGIYFVIQNVLGALYGEDTKVVSLGLIAEGTRIGSARITWVQLTAVVVAIVGIAGAAILLTRTRFGWMIRAVAADCELAAIRGVSSSRVILGSFILGSAVVALVGILTGIDIGVTPSMGFAPALAGMVAMIVGGADRIGGILIGAIVVSVIQQLATATVGGQWQDTLTFAGLVVALAWRTKFIHGPPLGHG